MSKQVDEKSSSSEEMQDQRLQVPDIAKQQAPATQEDEHIVDLKELVVEEKVEKENKEKELERMREREKTLPSNQVSDKKFTCGEWLVVVMSVILLIIFFPIAPFLVIRSVRTYARSVILRLGRLRGAVGPGIFCVIPCTDHYKVIDLRVRTFDVPQQEVLTRDSVTTRVDAVIYYRIHDSIKSVLNVADVNTATKLLAQTTLRNVIGKHLLQDLIAHREAVSFSLRNLLDEATESWGVTIDRVELKDIVLPAGMQRAMAAEAEAVRVARGKVVAAGGERLAAKNLRLAADEMMKSPAALQLRYLQTLTSIASEHNSTIVFPMPLDGPLGAVPRMMGGIAPALAPQHPGVSQALAAATSFMTQQPERVVPDKFEVSGDHADDKILTLLTSQLETATEAKEVKK